MRLKLFLLLTVLLLALTLVVGCGQQRAGQPSAKENIERQFEQAGLKDVDVDEDRDKGVIRLQGNVQSEQQKQQAEEIAKANAGNFVVANEIGVRPEGMEGDARSIASDLDAGIKNNLQAAFTANKLDGINIDVNNQVVTLKGEVKNAAQRKEAEQLAARVPNVQQVVNELEVEGQKAAREE